MKSIQTIPPALCAIAFASVLTGCGASDANIKNANASSQVGSISSVVASQSSVVSSISVQSSSTISSLNSSVVSSANSSANSASYVVTTFVTAAAKSGDGLSVDKNGNVYVGTSKGRTVHKVTPGGVVSLIATFATGSANGSDFDSQGNLFVANESGNIIHKITPEGVVSEYFTGLNGPAGIYVDEQDNLLVSLYGDSSPGAEVLKITPDKKITSYASGGGLTNVVGITGDGQGRNFAANFLTGEIFEITGGVVRQIGTAGTRVNHMRYLNGYIYMPNPFDNVVRRMDLNGNIELIAGTLGVSGSANGTATQATFSRPNSIDVGPDGKTLYVLDFNTGDVRRITIGAN
ncbi:hypothetical protein [Cellvibrio sp. OA-2007]|uniref:hypothetical protein n=1 Tax=Cellvibrio sp. OA-2007 TaxID=529823 RepID=UPI00078147F4|nr:hypothetical protein [Cellvibrio sp. OA-2007]